MLNDKCFHDLQCLHPRSLNNAICKGAPLTSCGSPVSEFKVTACVVFCFLTIPRACPETAASTVSTVCLFVCFCATDELQTT